MATVKEAFTCKYQSTKNSGIEEASFSPGDEVEVVKEWSNEMCLVRKRRRRGVQRADEEPRPVTLRLLAAALTRRGTLRGRAGGRSRWAGRAC